MMMERFVPVLQREPQPAAFLLRPAANQTQPTHTLILIHTHTTHFLQLVSQFFKKFYQLFYVFVGRVMLKCWAAGGRAARNIECDRRTDRCFPAVTLNVSRLYQMRCGCFLRSEAPLSHPRCSTFCFSTKTQCFSLSRLTKTTLRSDSGTKVRGMGRDDVRLILVFLNEAFSVFHLYRNKTFGFHWSQLPKYEGFLFFFSPPLTFNLGYNQLFLML